MGKSLFIDVSHLESRKLEFEETFAPGSLSLPDNWNLVSDLKAEGEAVLLDKLGARTIRIKGRLEGEFENACARCLAPIREELKGDFDLYFYPMEMIARKAETAISRDDADIGFYEKPGLELEDAITEQIVLWLPIRGLCRDDCRGICPQCGANLNETYCNCRETKSDPRWEALKKLKIEN